MNADYGHRIALWRKESKLSQRALGSVLGVSQGYIGDIEAGRSEPSRNFLQALSERFGVSADWILYGVGVPNSERAAGFEARKRGKRIEPPDLGMPYGGDFRFGSENFFMIERMDLDVSAGHGLLSVDGGEREMIALPRGWIINSRLAPDLAVLVRVKGDSMAPTIPDKSLILVDGMDKFSIRPGIYAFNRGAESYVKRLAPSSPDAEGRPTSIMIISDNPAYPPEGLTGADIASIQIVGRVRAVFATIE
ncbi:MAG: XRE family transcriptional regulator [Pseudomonadota bacterium]